MAKFQHGFNIVLKLKQSFLSLQPEMGERYGGRVGQGKLSHFTFNCQAVNQNKRRNFTFKQKILKDLDWT